MKKLSQSNRFARLTTPLGEDTLVLIDFDGYETISDNFTWTVDTLLNYQEDPIDPKDIIGLGCHVEIDTLEGEKRFFHGLCTEVRYLGSVGSHISYRLILRPWSWLLTQETNCEVFHEKKVDEIISAIFNDRSHTDFEVQTSKTYPKIPYCVQYQETPYDFVCRLMEKWGLFFHFQCTDSMHKMVITDDQSTLPDSGFPTIPYLLTKGSGSRETRLYSWQSETRLRTGKIEVDDYNYEKPNTALEKNSTAADSPKHAHAAIAKYRYPTGYYDASAGQLLADVRMGVERADAARKFCAGPVPYLFSGCKFTLELHPEEAENVEHVVVSAHHSASESYMLDTGTVVGSEGSYSGEYEVVDASLTYKAPVRTTLPRIYGAQTAVVIRSRTAPTDEEIDVDDEGRILVRFHWNPKSAASNQCSLRVRVAQIWAGSGWGGVWIPRVGMEVVVEFIGGDPDRPLVTGCVYNGSNQPPINFPADKTQSTIKSQSSKGGTSADNFNELRFEDKKDDEEIYIHAERDRMMIIEHDDDIEIGNDQTVKIGGSRTFELTGGDETLTIKGAPGTNDKYGTGITKNGHRTTTLEKGDETLTITEGKRTTTIEGNDSRTIKTGNDVHAIDKGNQTTTIKQGNQTTTVKLGNQTTKMSAGKGTVQAAQKYEIKVGGSKITMDPMSITIKAMSIKLDASMNFEAKGGISAKLQGGASCMVKGGIVMIN